jgi:hypothetical protein
MKLKHITESRGLLVYQRRFPQRLMSHPQLKGRPLYKRSLELRVGASEETILRAWKQANKQFEDYTALLELANTDILEQARKIELAEALLAANNLKPGMLAADATLSKEQSAALREHTLATVVDTDAFADLQQYDHPQWRGGLTTQVEIQSLAWKLINEPKSVNSGLTTLSQCWCIYESIKGIDMQEPNSKMAMSRFQRFVSLIGDQLMTQHACNDGLIRYVEAREQDREDSGGNTPTASTIQREVNAIVAVLNTVIKRRGLDIFIRRPELKKTQAKARYTYTRAELVALAALAQDKADGLYEPWKELAFLIMVQTGVIQSELQRLHKENLHLDHKVPHIDLRGELKTDQRERPNPIVYKLDRIKELVTELDDGSGYVFGQIATKQPKTVNKALVRVCQRINPDSTPYSCRHAFKNNALGAGVNPQLLAALGGWSGKELGFNSIMADYGKTGVRHLETLRQLQDAMIKINAHLLETSGSKVLQFPKR